MKDDLYFVVPNENEFDEWNPVAVNFKIWSDSLNQSLRIYCNKGNLYVKFPSSEWKRIVSEKFYEINGFSTTIDIFLPITKDKPESENENGVDTN